MAALTVSALVVGPALVPASAAGWASVWGQSSGGWGQGGVYGPAHALGPFRAVTGAGVAVDVLEWMATARARETDFHLKITKKWVNITRCLSWGKILHRKQSQDPLAELTFMSS